MNTLTPHANYFQKLNNRDLSLFPEIKQNWESKMLETDWKIKRMGITHLEIDDAWPEEQTIKVVCGLLHGHLEVGLETHFIKYICVNANLGQKIFKTFTDTIKLRAVILEYEKCQEKQNWGKAFSLKKLIDEFRIRDNIVQKCHDRFTTSGIVSRQSRQGTRYYSIETGSNNDLPSLKSAMYYVYEIVTCNGIYKFVIDRDYYSPTGESSIPQVKNNYVYHNK